MYEREKDTRNGNAVQREKKVIFSWKENKQTKKGLIGQNLKVKRKIIEGLLEKKSETRVLCMVRIG